jgi:hypothetical protein
MVISCLLASHVLSMGSIMHRFRQLSTGFLMIGENFFEGGLAVVGRCYKLLL